MTDILNFIFSFIGDILGTLDNFLIDNNLSLLSLYCCLLVLPLVFLIFKLGFKGSFLEERAYVNYSMRENARAKYEQKTYIGKHTKEYTQKLKQEKHQ